MVCTFFRFAVYTDARSIAVTACNRLIIAAAGKRTSRTNTRSISASYRRTITARIKLYAALHETADQSSD